MDGQNDQSHNLLQCSLRSHLAQIINQENHENCRILTIGSCYVPYSSVQYVILCQPEG